MNGEFLKQINDDFRRIVETAHEPTAREQMEQLRALMLELNFTMSGKPFPTFLKPLLLESKVRSYLARVTNTIMDCVEKVSDLFFSNPELEPFFELDPLDRELAKIDPHYPRRVINGRLDAFLYEDGLKFLEFNCDSPCGMGWHDHLVTLLSQLPVMQEFRDLYEARFEPLLPNLYAMFQKKARQVGIPEDATYAIVADRESTVRHDLELIVEYLRRQGRKALYADPRDGEYDGKTLRMQGEPVGLVFRDAIQEFTDHMDQVKPVLDAFRDGNICFINPFSSRVGGLKCVLWFMTDDRTAHLFNAEEKRIIAETIPWTRFMKEGKTNRNGTEIDLFEHVRKNKDQFVLKPNAGYGGFGVTIGRSVTQQRWEEVIEAATRESWVVQEVVDIPTDLVPEFSPDLRWTNKNVNINFFAFDGVFGGAIVRVSDSDVINVHQGGGLIPICYVDGPR
jgi:hypothetical protein